MKLNSAVSALNRATMLTRLGAARLQLAALDPVEVLLPEVVRLVFLLLPVDARLRCREVCRGWRDFLEDPHLWRVCDLSALSGVAAECTPALLRAATERAQGTLQELDVSGGAVVGWLGVLAALRENTVQRFRGWGYFPDYDGWQLEAVDVVALLEAAPTLLDAQCDVMCKPEECLALFARGPPLYLHAIVVECADEEGAGMLDCDCVALRAAAPPSLREITLSLADLSSAEQLGALVELAEAQLTTLRLLCCEMTPAALPPLARLLTAGRLTQLTIDCDDQLLTGAAVPAFCAALRASRLRTLEVCGAGLDGWTAAGLLPLLAACGGHATLRELLIASNGPLQEEERWAAAQALGALVDAASLHALSVLGCGLGDDELAPLFAAVARSKMLRSLSVLHNPTTPAFGGLVVLPAVRANTSLKELRVCSRGVVASECVELEQAEELVRRRAAREPAAALR